MTTYLATTRERGEEITRAFCSPQCRAAYEYAGGGAVSAATRHVYEFAEVCAACGATVPASTATAN